MIKLLLRPFKLVKPEWFDINFLQIKKIMDFSIMMYDNYKIHETTDNLSEFVSRYKSNRLINSNQARVIVLEKYYKQYVEENIVYNEKYKISTDLLCQDFYEWYKKQDMDEKHIKMENGNWSVCFQKEITSLVSKYTNLEYKTRINLSDVKRGLLIQNSSGFIGIETKAMNNMKAEYFDEAVYRKYINDFITITDNHRNKVARVELLEDFIIWVNNNNFTTKTKIFTKNHMSSVFKEDFIQKIQEITGLELQKNITKVSHQGCFIGMLHKNFEFHSGNKHIYKNKKPEFEYIKQYIHSWSSVGNTTLVSKIFKECVKNEYQISVRRVRDIMGNSYTNLAKNQNKHKWYYVFAEVDDNYIIKDMAKEYIIKNYSGIFVDHPSTSCDAQDKLVHSITHASEHD
jgi:hypothetical protein